MENLDERAKLEYWKINNEIFLFSAIFPIVLLVIKLILNVGIMGMLGEIVVLGIILIYFIVQFIYILKNGIADERVKQNIYKLSTVFFIAGVVCLGVIGMMNAIIRWEGQEERINILTNTPYLLLTAWYGFSMLYRLIRTSNEKFMGQKSVDMPYINYKRKITVYVMAGTIILAVFIIIIVVMVISAQNENYSLYESGLITSIGYACILCLSLPCCWIAYFKCLKAKRRLEEKIDKTKGDAYEKL